MSHVEIIESFLRAARARESHTVLKLLKSAIDKAAGGGSSGPSQDELLNASDPLSGGTALHLAIRGNKFGDNASSSGVAGEDPLTASSSDSSLLDTAEVLLTAGIPLEALDNWGASALVLALNLRQRALVDRLYKAGANLHFKLHWAAEQGYEDVAREVRGALRSLTITMTSPSGR
jgi:ankyrin repeat protein